MMRPFCQGRDEGKEDPKKGKARKIGIPTKEKEGGSQNREGKTVSHLGFLFSYTSL